MYLHSVNLLTHLLELELLAQMKFVWEFYLFAQQVAAEDS
jgi:hypothetical protein